MVVINVDLDDFCAAYGSIGDLIDDWSKLDARATPRSPEVHENGLFGLDDFGLEGGVGDIKNIDAGHGGFLENAWLK